MLTVVSPAKSLDLATPPPSSESTQPRFLDDAALLAARARKLSAAKLGALMHISGKLAALNAARFKAFEPHPSDARPAIHTFAGDVYRGFDAASADTRTLDFAQDHLRILSGLYGLLRPRDLIQPYRLEMGTRLATRGRRDLYAFWGDRIAAALADDLADHNDKTLVNLASLEYFKAVRIERLEGPVVTPTFKHLKDGELVFEAFVAKRMRGRMSRWICDQRLDRANGLRDFDVDGYRYQPELSDEATLVFVRS